jgi:sialate O-acetylesterase
MYDRQGLVMLLSGLGLVLAVSPARAEVKLPAVLSSHMVLQRDRAVPVWGTAKPGEKVTVSFRKQERSTEADKDGKWLVKLEALEAGGPDRLTVRGSNTVTLEDVLVGEVWVGSGQSNMAGGVNGYVKGDKVLAGLVEAAPYEKVRLLRGAGRWQPATERNVRGFSALLFAFGVRLHKDLKVPVGLMVGAVGGTPSGYWLSEAAFRADPACRSAVKKFADSYPALYEKLLKKYQRDLKRWEQLAQAAKEAGKKPPRKPVPPMKPGVAARGKIGHLYEQHVRPMIPHAIRGVLWDQGESGTAVNGVDQYTLMGALIRGWRKERGQGDFPFLYVQKPSGGGCAWDADDPVTARAEKFGPLPRAVPGAGEGLYREVHLRIRRYPNTGLVIASDLGGGIHPANKSGYGARAARVALGMVYGRKVEYYGPMYDTHKVDGDTVRLTFTHTGKGLAFRHGEKLQGFAVAGKDRVFHWADAKIDGEAVVVSSPKVKEPVAVRYAWAQRHPWANLFNKDGLPATTFRTDDW